MALVPRVLSLSAREAGELATALAYYSAARGAVIAASSAGGGCQHPQADIEASAGQATTKRHAKKEASEKLRVLCLHGFTQNAEIFRNKTGSARKAMRGCEFDFVEAPHSAAGAFPDEIAADLDTTAVEGDVVGSGPRGWWTAGENASRAADETWVRPAEARICDGWDESLECARREVAAKGPFDGIFAFSQGCAVTAALLREASVGALDSLKGVHFAVLVGGFLPRDDAIAAQLQGEPLSLHTLHVTGLADELVPRHRTEELAALFDLSRATWLEHSGRHGVPTGTGPFKQALRNLLDKRAP